MFLTNKLLAAQRHASERVKQGKSYSVALPIIGRVPVPSPEQLAIYAALGGLAVLELIDWPVALAMGVGSTVVSRRLADLKAREEELAESLEPQGAPSRNAPVIKAASTSAAAKSTAARATAAKATTAKRPPAKAAAKKVTGKKAPATSGPARQGPKKASADSDSGSA